MLAVNIIDFSHDLTYAFDIQNIQSMGAFFLLIFLDVVVSCTFNFSGVEKGCTGNKWVNYHQSSAVKKQFGITLLVLKIQIPQA